MQSVGPSWATPRHSWMWPCKPSSGWRLSMISRTAVEPTGIAFGWPPSVTMRRS